MQGSIDLYICVYLTEGDSESIYADPYVIFFALAWVTQGPALPGSGGIPGEKDFQRAKIVIITGKLAPLVILAWASRTFAGWELYEKKVKSQIVSDSLQPHGLGPIRLLHSWDFPGKNTGVHCHFFLQGIFPTQELNLGLLHCR